MLSLADKLNFIQRAFGPYRISRDSRNVDVRCPICNSTDKTKLKLSILTDDVNAAGEPVCLGAHCWTCGYRSRSLFGLLIKHGNRELLREYEDRFLPEAMRHRSYDLDDAPMKEQKLELPNDFKLLATSSSHDPDVQAMRKYLIERHVSERDLWYYKLGYSNEAKWRRRIIMPSFNADGELNFFVGRTIDKRCWLRYDNPDVPRGSIIFNELNVDWKQRLVLCEGPFDLMKCGDNAVPLLGSDLNERSALFSRIIENRTPIALALDSDMRTKKTPLNARRLMAFDIDVVIVQVLNDPGEMSKQEFKEQLAAAQHLDWADTFRDRLEQATRVRL